MDISALASKPQLIKLTIDKEDIVKKYGDVLEFYIYDRQNIEDFVRMATASQEDQYGMIKMISSMIMTEDAKPALKEDETLPNDVMMAVINEVIKQLGK
jgi:hypothetical protein